MLLQTGRLQAQPALQALPGRLVELRAGPPGPLTRVRAPSTSPLRPQSAGVSSATFLVTYNGFSPQAQAAFQAAIDIWAGQISSPVPIRINANWSPLGANSGVLGSAGPTQFVPNFPGAPHANTYYPIALANKLAGTDLDPVHDDIDANFNSQFGSWYYGTDGNTPAGLYDLESVVLHEVGHGLGFIGSASDANGSLMWGISGDPFIFDRFVVNGSSQAIINTTLFPNPSAGLASQLTGGNLFFNGANARGAGQNPKLYVPASWQEGSSYSHLDEAAYPAGDQNSLMTPFLGPGESIHAPGPIALGIFADSGWSVDAGPTTPTATPASQIALPLVRS